MFTSLCIVRVRFEELMLGSAEASENELSHLNIDSNTMEMPPGLPLIFQMLFQWSDSSEGYMAYMSNMCQCLLHSKWYKKKPWGQPNSGLLLS